jgi:Arc/MetJ-type ribon-helix-helix transcriptional regulator
MGARKAVTVRILQSRLRHLMRARNYKSQSELINALLAEEEERLKSHRVLRETQGKLKRSEVNDRLL